MAETAQFTMVQKLDALSALDQKVLDATKAQSAAGLIGRQVTYSDLAGKPHTGTVTGTTYGSHNPNPDGRRHHRRARRGDRRGHRHGRQDHRLRPVAQHHQQVRPGGTTPRALGTDAALTPPWRTACFAPSSPASPACGQPDVMDVVGNNIANVNTAGYKSSIASCSRTR